MSAPFRPPAAEIRKIALGRGAAACGFVRAGALPEYERFRIVSENAPPGLGYLRRFPSPRGDIREWFSGARSVLMCAFRYWHSGLDHTAALEKAGEPLAYLKRTGRRPRPEFIAGVKVLGMRPKISRYALAPDYHEVIRQKLGLMLSDIKAAYGGAGGRPFTDTSPVMEKELGRLAGLGFRGKNTLLISGELGSWFFIGGLALTFEIEPESGFGARKTAPGCAACRKCVDACPTGALKNPGILDAELCVSYWTTQAKTRAPDEIVKRSGGYVYGCDICQEVCPYNNSD
ncbi:MAG: hypothetical protein A2X28_06640 [Elusimicrobia bacterium GWA2_56_46]|nr:MAG: hypothetical protein A2X28_06640 [Elusimicrobia bacterium GWA2_56_46]OGR54872.1 MAG: hypothetical protein A2X39_11350 [Elusimicrobia bacterium GWC2_56_31]HBB66127.1 hypothetical protein [Elusimicrobiota bacterium]HBW23334.1 hypothetical protein [Elusimicrobiota bacterium]